MYLSDFRGSKGYLVMHGRKGFLFTDARYHLVAKSQIPASFEIVDITKGLQKPWREFLKRHKVRKFGVEGNSITFAFFKKLRKISKGARLIDIKSSLDERRMVKKPAELYDIKFAQRITDKIFLALKKWIKSGVREKDIEWKIKVLAHEFGANDLSFVPIVAFAENSAAPHYCNTDRKLKRGDMILIDMGVKFNGYCSDMTRVLFTKRPTEEQKRVYEIVRRAQMAAIKSIKKGMIGKNIDGIARHVIKKAGFGKQFGHSLGHSVGLDIHELPNLSPKYKGKLPAGCIVTVEPGIYLPGKFGVRIEDMVLVTSKGTLNLTKTPKNLKSCIINI